ncbi:MAG: DNA primase DnaG [Candidatus Bilamarchaeaceae archaeon]
MGKTYIDTVKYLVYSKVEIQGLVEKPDVVGAIFGQTEGLLGDELDLRDLQKSGRIGRIEVDLEARGGATSGIIKIPSSLDMVETCIIAAALETVDRVGPCEARISVEKVEDTRNVKRKQLVDKAKILLRTLLSTEIPESKEISELVRNEVKVAEITEYGADRLPAGPGIANVNEVIFVEGRADVINMLKNNITNVVAIGGAKVPKTIVELSREKEVTVFLDGDRGGDIILNELTQGGAEMDFVARAPTGKEVEELTRKEIIKCIRSKVPFEQADAKQREQREARGGYGDRDRRRGREGGRDEQRQKPFEQSWKPRDQFQPQQRDAPREHRDVPRDTSRDSFREQHESRDTYHPRERRDQPTFEPSAPRLSVEKPVMLPEPNDKMPASPEPFQSRIEAPEPKPKAEAPSVPRKTITREQVLAELDELNNTLRARLYNDAYELINEIPVRDVIKSLEATADVKTIVFDGIITQRLVDLAEGKGVSLLVGVKLGNVNKRPQKLELVTKLK